MREEALRALRSSGRGILGRNKGLANGPCSNVWGDKGACPGCRRGASSLQSSAGAARSAANPVEDAKGRRDEEPEGGVGSTIPGGDELLRSPERNR